MQANANLTKGRAEALLSNSRFGGIVRKRLTQTKTIVNAYRTHRYIPRGTMDELWNTIPCYEELVLSGPAGTGKSRFCLEFMYRCAMIYPNMRGLIVRKVRADLTESGLVTFDDKVLGPGHPLTEGERARRSRYDFYHNNATIVVGGLDQGDKKESSKVMSTEYDLIFVQEATQLTIRDWENLVTRLRNGAMPFQALIADCNPSSPNHWIKKRGDSGGLKLVHTNHKDNPILWNGDIQEWTDLGKAYIAQLEKLTGVRKARLLAGLWAQAEGTVYDTFSEMNKTTLEADPFLPTGLAYDDGYHPDPRAILFVQEKPNGDILVFDEMFHNRHLAETCVNETIDRFALGWPLSDQAVSDFQVQGMGEKLEKRQDGRLYLKDGWRIPEIAIGGTESKEMKERFRRANIVARGGTHSPITNGIDRMRRYICDDNQRRRLQIHERCSTLISEIEEGYKYPDGGKVGDTPMDENNHGCDALRYYLWLRGEK